MLTLPPLVSKQWIDAACLYNNFFLSRYVSQDIANLCGSVFDTPFMKTLILFMFLYSAARNIQIATVLTFGVVVVNVAMSYSPMCYPLADKDDQEHLGVGFWAAESNRVRTA